jgi:hypothetical protein
MRYIAKALTLLLLLSFGVFIATGASADPCGGGSDAQDGAYWLRCDAAHHHGGGGPLGPGGGGGEGRHYNYYWLPSCPGALPGVPGAEQMDCREAHSCGDPRMLSLSLFSQLVDGNGHPVTGWRYMRSECRSPSHIGPADPRHPLTWSDIRAAIKRIGVPPSSVEGPHYTLVNLRTTFYTKAAPFDRSFVLLGYHVDVHITPVTYIWRWGDSSTSTTHQPGRPYPARDVTHTYRHATDEGVTLPLRVDVAYRATFRIDGGDWVSVSDQLVIAGTTRQLPVKQASAVLVPGLGG